MCCIQCHVSLVYCLVSSVQCPATVYKYSAQCTMLYSAYYPPFSGQCKIALSFPHVQTTNRKIAIQQREVLVTSHMATGTVCFFPNYKFKT